MCRVNKFVNGRSAPAVRKVSRDGPVRPARTESGVDDGLGPEGVPHAGDGGLVGHRGRAGRGAGRAGRRRGHLRPPGRAAHRGGGALHGALPRQPDVGGQPGRPRRRGQAGRRRHGRLRRGRPAGQQRRHPQAPPHHGARHRHHHGGDARQLPLADAPDLGPAAPDAGPRLGHHREHLVGRGHAERPGRGGLRRLEGGAHRLLRGDGRRPVGRRGSRSWWCTRA